MSSTCNKIISSHKLLFGSILSDLGVFNWWQGIIICLFAVISITFSIVNFNALIYPNSGLLILNWYNDEANGIEFWRRVIMELSGVASFTGVICVVLTTAGKITSYFWGIINCIFYGVFAFTYGYAGDAQLNIILFLPMQFIGIYLWEENLDDTQTAKSRSLKYWQWLAIGMLTCGFGVAFYYEIPVFAKALTGTYYFEGKLIPRILDSVANALSITAQILSLYRFWQQWIFWIAIDCIQIAMYAGIAGYGIQFNIMVMWILFLINATVGLYRWIGRYSDSKGPKSSEVMVADVRLSPHVNNQKLDELDLDLVIEE
jgi:nicotinamide mononucleotide transporter PnuC